MTRNSSYATSVHFKPGTSQKLIFEVDNNVFLAIVFRASLGYYFDYLEVLINAGTLLRDCFDQGTFEQILWCTCNVLIKLQPKM